MDLQQDLVCIRLFANSSFPWPKRTTRHSWGTQARKTWHFGGLQILQVRPLSLLSHKPGTLGNNIEIKICSPSITKHACFALSQDHDYVPCPICCDIPAASDKTFLVPTHFENSGCRSTSWCTVGNLQAGCPCRQSARRSNLIIHRRISC